VAILLLRHLRKKGAPGSATSATTSVSRSASDGGELTEGEGAPPSAAEPPEPGA